VAQDTVFEVREALLKQVFKGLKDVRLLPLRFMSLLVLYATDSEKELLERAKKYLQTCIEIRRKVLQTNQDSIDQPALYALLPENALPFVVHLIAHIPRFPEDAPQYRDTDAYLSFFLQELLHGADNFSFLVEVLQFIQQTLDTQDLSSNNIHIVAEIALMIVRQRMNKKSFQAKHPGTVYLPPSLFTLPNDTVLPSQSYLQAGFQLPKKALIDDILSKPVPPPKQTEGEEKPPKKSRKKIPSEKKDKSEEKSETGIKAPKKRSHKKSKSKTRSEKEASEEEESLKDVSEDNQKKEKSEEPRKDKKSKSKSKKHSKKEKWTSFEEDSDEMSSKENKKPQAKSSKRHSEKKEETTSKRRRKV